MSRAVLTAAIAGLAMPSLAIAQTFTSDTGGSVTFYGQLSPTFQIIDDGVESYTNLADNTNSNSRLGFNLDQELTNGQTLRFNFEAAVGFPGTSAFTQEGDDPFWEWEITDLRKAEMIWSGEFGVISFGQGSMATDGSAGSDLSGTTLTATPFAPDSAGGFFFRDDNTRDLTSVAIADVYNDFDGGRRFRLRYDTPEFNGLTVALAYGTNELSEGDEDTYYDVALHYGDTVGDVALRGSLGYAWRDRDEGDTDETWVGSFALRHTPTGLNGAIAAGGTDGGGRYTYVKAGWIGTFWQVGDSNFAVDYYNGSDFDSDGSNSSNWGLHYTQGFDAAGIEGYLGWRSYSFDDDSGTEYRDASSLLAGVRWRF